MADDDLSTAESAYAILLAARRQPRDVAAELVRPLKERTQNSGTRSREVETAQANAWLAICALIKSLDTEPETSAGVWSRALSRTEEWRNILS
jgi:hypothetical protein